MSHSVSIVTGANSGVGRAIATALASAGEHVVMVCRSGERGEVAQREIQASTGGGLDLVVADLSLQVEVRRLAHHLLATYPGIKILVNNAGAIFNDRQLTADGIEHTFALNHLASFLLTNLLLGRLRDNSPARIVNLASNASVFGRLSLDNLQGERSYTGLGAYARSKLANIIFTRTLANRLQDSEVTVNCLHPGTIISHITDHNAAPVRLYFRVFGTTAEVGADTAVWLATSDDVAGRSGGYFIKRRERRVPRLAKNRDLAEQLWQESERLTAGPATQPVDM